MWSITIVNYFGAAMPQLLGTGGLRLSATLETVGPEVAANGAHLSCVPTALGMLWQAPIMS